MANILIINGSVRKNGNSQILADQAEKGARQVKDTQVRQFAFFGKEFAGCRAECAAYCQQHGKCAIHDDLQSLWEEFLWADGIVWVVPVYHVGVPGQVKCAMDRLCNMQYKYFQGRYPRWNKVWGSIAQGASRWGGQEFTIQWLIESALLMKCLPIAADAPKSYFGVAGHASSWDKSGIEADETAMALAENMGKRGAETAQIFLKGREALQDQLEMLYFPQECYAQRAEAFSDS